MSVYVQCSSAPSQLPRASQTELLSAADIGTQTIFKADVMEALNMILELYVHIAPSTGGQAPPSHFTTVSNSSGPGGPSSHHGPFEDKPNQTLQAATRLSVAEAKAAQLAPQFAEAHAELQDLLAEQDNHEDTSLDDTASTPFFAPSPCQRRHKKGGRHGR